MILCIRHRPLHALVVGFGIAVTASAVPTITVQPKDTSVTEGFLTTLSVGATGRGTLRYQWKKDGVPVPGDYVRIDSATAADAGQYMVTVTDADGSVDSRAATLTVLGAVDAPPFIFGQPPAVIELDGSANVPYPLWQIYPPTSFGKPIYYQWLHDGVAVPGATDVGISDEQMRTYGTGNYTVVVSWPGGRTESDPIHVTGAAIAKPVIYIQPPQIADALPGGTIDNLEVTTNVSEKDATFVWRRNGTIVTGATTARYYIANMDASQAGDYAVTISNAAGTVTSHVAHVTMSESGARPLLVYVPGDLAVDPRYSPGNSILYAGANVTRVAILRDGAPIPTNELSVFGSDVEIFRPSSGVRHTYSGTITTTAGTATFPSFTASYIDLGEPPRIAHQSGNATGDGSLTVYARGEWPLHTTWYRDGQVVNGTSDYQETLTTSGPGTYTVRITNAYGSVTSEPMRVDPLPDTSLWPRLPLGTTGRLRNLSARGQVESTVSPLIAGFVIGGGGSKRVLIRAAGPSLAGYGISQPLRNPVLRVLDHDQHELAANDNWDDTDAAGIAAAGKAAGAFEFAAGSTDAAVVVTLPPGDYTAVVTGGGTGIALAEVYDLDSETAPSRLVNLSVRGRTGSGEAVLIPGAVVTPAGVGKYLWRAVGPTLADYGVTNPEPNPSLAVIDASNRTMAINDDWGTSPDAAALQTTATAVAAFPLRPGSTDAAALVPMVGGNWTALVGGTSPYDGTVLVEMYEVP